MSLDVSAIRSQFPALERTLDGQPYAYFDGPGGSQVPQVVADAMTHSLLHQNANSGGAFATSHEADASVQAAREAGRRSVCNNNIKQLGLAMHLHHEVKNKFPAGGWTDHRNWRVDALPFIEEVGIFSSSFL